MDGSYLESKSIYQVGWVRLRAPSFKGESGARESDEELKDGQQILQIDQKFIFWENHPLPSSQKGNPPPSLWDLALFQAPLFLFPGFQIKCKSASEVAPNLNIWSCSHRAPTAQNVSGQNNFSFLFYFTKYELFLNVSLHRPKPSWCFHNARGCL